MIAQLVGEGGVVGEDVGQRAGQDVAVPVVVLQPLAGQRGAAGGGAHQEAAPRASPNAQIWSPVRWKPNIE